MGNSKKRLPSKGGNNNSKDDEDDPRESRGNQRSTQRVSERVANGSGSQEKSRAVKSLQKKVHKKPSVCEKSITIKRKPKAPAPVKSSFLEEEDDDEDDEEDEDYIPNEQDLNDDLTSEEEDNALDEEEDNALDEDEEKSDNDSDEDFGLNEDVDVSRSTTNAMGSQRLIPSSQNQAGNAFPDSTRIAVLDGGVIQLTLSGGRFTLSGTNQQFQVIGSNNQLQVTGNGNNIRITGSDNSIRTPPGSNHGNIIETNGERNVIMEEPSTLNFPRVLPSRPLNPNFPLIPPPRNPGPLPRFPRPPQTINSTVNGLLGNERFQMPFSEFLAAIQGRQVHNSERVVQARPIPRPRTNCISIGGAGESGSPRQERSWPYRNIPKKQMKLVKGNAHPADGNEDPDSSEEIEEVLVQKPASQRQSPQPSQVESNIQRRDIVNEQNRAYEESLMADQAKQEKKRMEEEEKLMKEQREEHRRQLILKSKEEAKLNLPSEPNSGNSELEPAENVVNLHFRLPSGASVQRNFRTSDTLSVVFQYVYSNPETPERFDLLRRPAQVFILGCLELSLTLQELGFQGKELLVVRDQYAENGDEKKLEHAEIA